jgi:opacity protein-like surface antigen
MVLGVLLSFCLCGAAVSRDNNDDDDDQPRAAPQFPTTYLDLRTNYNTVPANSLSLGFSGPGILATLPVLSARPFLPSLPSLSSPSSRSLSVDVPLTFDLNDAISVYGGITASASQSGTTSWSSLAVTSWNVGLQADIYRQNGGWFPTITIQPTVTRSVPDSPLATTSFNFLAEADYALNKDETRGLLAGFQHTRVAVDSPLATINPTTIGYVGAYYQWDNNWKLTGRAGVQAFEGAQILALAQLPAFTQPIVRFDLDRMDDNDNRLFGVTAEIAWTPKPAYQLTLRTPLYLIRN